MLPKYRATQNESGEWMAETTRLKDKLERVAVSRPNAFTFPNLLTLARVALVPCFLYLVLQWLVHGDSNARLLAVACFAGIALSDLVDGFLARRWGQDSALGSLLDPAADFLFVMVSFIVLGVYDRMPMWLVIIAVSRCILLSVGWLLRYAVTAILRTEPSLLGKSTTFLQFLCVGLALLDVPPWLFLTVCSLTALAAFVTLGDYLLAGLSQTQRRAEATSSNGNQNRGLRDIPPAPPQGNAVDQHGSSAN